MGWWENLKRRWERGGRTGLPVTGEPDVEDRIFSTPPGHDHAAVDPVQREDDTVQREGHAAADDEPR